MIASCFVIMIEPKAPFGPQMKCIWFYCSALKANINPPPIPWNKAKLFNASWRGLWVTLIIKMTCLGTLGTRCLLEMGLLVSWDWAGFRNWARLGNIKYFWGCSEVHSSGFHPVHLELNDAWCGQVEQTWITVFSNAGFRVAGNSLYPWFFC